MKLSSVNVISSSTVEGTINFLHAFSDNNKGNKEAEKLFVEKATAFGCPEEDMAAALEDGYYNGIEDSVWLVHSM